MRIGNSLVAVPDWPSHCEQDHAERVAALDQTFRRPGGVATYVLTDKEKTVTTERMAGSPVRNPHLAAFAQHYSMVVHTCVPADPVSKDGSESSVKISKADRPLPDRHQPAGCLRLVR